MRCIFKLVKDFSELTIFYFNNLVGLCYFSEKFNELGAKHWKLVFNCITATKLIAY